MPCLGVVPLLLPAAVGADRAGTRPGDVLGGGGQVARLLLDLLGRLEPAHARREGGGRPALGLEQLECDLRPVGPRPGRLIVAHVEVRRGRLGGREALGAAAKDAVASNNLLAHLSDEALAGLRVVRAGPRDERAPAGEAQGRRREGRRLDEGLVHRRVGPAELVRAGPGRREGRRGRELGGRVHLVRALGRATKVVRLFGRARVHEIFVRVVRAGAGRLVLGLLAGHAWHAGRKVGRGRRALTGLAPLFGVVAAVLVLVAVVVLAGSGRLLRLEDVAVRLAAAEVRLALRAKQGERGLVVPGPDGVELVARVLAAGRTLLLHVALVADLVPVALVPRGDGRGGGKPLEEDVPRGRLALLVMRVLQPLVALDVSARAGSRRGLLLAVEVEARDAAHEGVAGRLLLLHQGRVHLARVVPRAGLGVEPVFVIRETTLGRRVEWRVPVVSAVGLYAAVRAGTNQRHCRELLHGNLRLPL
mmetsp:Transcript_3003/g.7318  ORF Transcript_3003/g.7318 Transcript_3003/m.7318 type:complete len:476 (-) Transcript_3003:517-1944(-)